MTTFYKKESSIISGKKHQMQCACCDALLGTLFESNDEFDGRIKSKDILIKYKCICYCGGETFFVKCDKKCYFIPLFDINVVKIDWIEKDGFVENIIVLEK